MSTPDYEQPLSIEEKLSHKVAYYSPEYVGVTYPNEWPIRSDEAKAQKARYKEVEAQRIALFRQELMADLGVTNPTVAEALWELAWERGHSHGLYEVFIVAVDLEPHLRKVYLAGKENR